MSTSGTIATTVIDTAVLLEHACRRAGISASKQTPEIIVAAQESIYLLLLNLSNKGLNLWCLDRYFQSLLPGKPIYQLPSEVLNVTNVTFSKPSLVSLSQVGDTASFTNNLVMRVGLLFTVATESDTVTIEASTDNITWVTIASKTGNLVLDEVIWIQPDVIAEYSYIRATTVDASTFTIYVANNIQDLPVMPWSRDTYSVINNKFQQGSPSINYLLERKIPVQITLWPVPNTITDHLTLMIYRQIQDIGSLSQQIEVPQRWMEGITWQAALRIAVETEGVDPSRIQLCKQMADEYTLDAELDEEDGMPVYMAPNISVYTS